MQQQENVDNVDKEKTGRKINIDAEEYLDYEDDTDREQREQEEYSRKQKIFFENMHMNDQLVTEAMETYNDPYFMYGVERPRDISVWIKWYKANQHHLRHRLWYEKKY